MKSKGIDKKALMAAIVIVLLTRSKMTAGRVKSKGNTVSLFRIEFN